MDIEVERRRFFCVVPGEGLREVNDLVALAHNPLYTWPSYPFLQRALGELGGQQSPVELPPRDRFRQPPSPSSSSSADCAPTESSPPSP